VVALQFGGLYPFILILAWSSLLVGALVNKTLNPFSPMYFGLSVMCCLSLLLLAIVPYCLSFVQLLLLLAY
jgi:hypothetical protein